MFPKTANKFPDGPERHCAVAISTVLRSSSVAKSLRQSESKHYLISMGKHRLVIYM